MLAAGQEDSETADGPGNPRGGDDASPGGSGDQEVGQRRESAEGEDPQRPHLHDSADAEQHGGRARRPQHGAHER